MLVLGLLGLGAFLLAPTVERLLDGRNLPFKGQFLRGLYQTLVAVGVGSAVVLALTPVLALLFWVSPRFDRLYGRCEAAYETTLYTPTTARVKPSNPMVPESCAPKRKKKNPLSPLSDSLMV